MVRNWAKLIVLHDRSDLSPLTKNLPIPLSPGKIPLETPPPCQRFIPPLNHNFHVITQWITSFLTVVIALVPFSFYLLLYVQTGNVNFDLNQCSLFTECCF